MNELPICVVKIFDNFWGKGTVQLITQNNLNRRVVAGGKIIYDLSFQRFIVIGS